MKKKNVCKWMNLTLKNKVIKPKFKNVTKYIITLFLLLTIVSVEPK